MQVTRVPARRNETYLQEAARLVEDAVPSTHLASPGLALAVEGAGTAAHRDALDVEHTHLVVRTLDLTAGGRHRGEGCGERDTALG